MKPVMLATDGSPTASEATRTAIDLAQALGTDLYIVTVWDIPYATVAMAAPGVTPNVELAKLSEEEARKANAEAASLAEEAGIETRSVVLRGFPVEEICLAAESFQPRFLVVGSHGWGPIKRAIFGSVSTGVLHHAGCPVLVVRGDHGERSVVVEGDRDKIPA
jgi:nucleotide-binding universal stress UspA family protein